MGSVTRLVPLTKGVSSRVSGVSPSRLNHAERAASRTKVAVSGSAAMTVPNSALAVKLDI